MNTSRLLGATMVAGALAAGGAPAQKDGADPSAGSSDPGGPSPGASYW
jgi:hypothetical protein